MKILYLHGFNSGPTSNTVGLLREAFPEDTIVALNLAHHRPHSVFRQLSDYFMSHVAQNGYDDLVVVGTSMGGFWAELMQRLYGFPTVVINPCRHPNTQLAKHVCTNTNYVTGHRETFRESDREDYLIYESLLNNFGVRQTPMISIVYEGDVVIDANTTCNEMSAYCDVRMFHGGGHQITKDQLPDVVTAILDVTETVIGETD